MVKHVKIGKSDLNVNPVGLGTNAVGGHNLFPDLDEQAGKDLVKTAIENGINFIDTAYLYGPGRSEELVGEAVKETGRREELVIATKISPVFTDDGMEQSNEPSFLKEEVQKSLERLQTDYIDLMYLHYPDEDTPKDQAIAALKELKDEGRIRAIGVSNFSLDELKEANKDGHIDVFQGEYNLLARSAEDELFPYLKEQGISFVPFFPLASGLLTGKFSKEDTFNDLRENLPAFQGEAFAGNIEKVEKLRPIAEGKGVDIAHVVLAWYLTRDVIDVIIPGAKRSEQVLNNLKALEVGLSQDEINEIDKIFS
ncbi:aldo/keto reductase [Salinicoccus halodurans]|uniref:Methylglyoxal reductase n=1 Tax=Salinicoccus halodurans TaxID=407035 RepID=A0A0F7HJM3_9STAP|nr:aldo/keto reductase [Salinicoccus halodurans]AKG73597.1 oxidoreductase [Salinicoccus halodurans]SFK53173.1 methylglyoxal reductase [Salinicoccus halodurans]